MGGDFDWLVACPRRGAFLPAVLSGEGKATPLAAPVIYLRSSELPGPRWSCLNTLPVQKLCRLLLIWCGASEEMMVIHTRDSVSRMLLVPDAISQNYKGQ